MANIKLQPQRSINYRCSQFPKDFRIAASLGHLNLFLYREIRLECKV